MSITVIKLVFDKSKTKGNARLILIALADNASDEGYCFPSIKTIAKKANVSINTAKIYVRAFDAMGLVKREERKRAGWQTSNGYQMDLGMIERGQDEVSQETIKSVTPPSLKNRKTPFSEQGKLANPAPEQGLPVNPPAGLASKPPSRVSLQTYEPSLEPLKEPSLLQPPAAPALPPSENPQPEPKAKRARSPKQLEQDAEVKAVCEAFSAESGIPMPPKLFTTPSKRDINDWLAPAKSLIGTYNGRSVQAITEAVTKHRAQRKNGEPLAIKNFYSVKWALPPLTPQAQPPAPVFKDY